MKMQLPEDQKSSIVFVPPQSIRPNPDNSELQLLLATLLVPELSGNSAFDEAGRYESIYRWLATSELLKFCASEQWHHPAICPKKYPRGWKKSAEALGRLWIKVWQICHRWFDSADALWAFEEMSREYGGLLTPYSWYPDPDVINIPVVSLSGDKDVNVLMRSGARRAARTARETGDTPERYINKAATLLRRGENPYLPGTESYDLINRLVHGRTTEKSIQLTEIADAIKEVALVLGNGPSLGGGLRFKPIKKKSNSFDWPAQRNELLAQIKLATLKSDGQINLADGLGVIFAGGFNP
jgi:hypothetical protein